MYSLSLDLYIVYSTSFHVTWTFGFTLRVGSPRAEYSPFSSLWCVGGKLGDTEVPVKSLLECFWCSARIRVSGACQMAVQNSLRYPARIFLIIPPSCRRKTEGRREIRRCCDGIFIILCDWCWSERSNPKKLCTVITACWVTRARSRAHTRAPGRRCGMVECVWNDVHLQGPWELQGLGRNMNSAEIKGQRSPSCSHVKYPVLILTHTYTRALESTSSYCLKTAQSWTGADGMWGFKELHV